MRLDEKAAEIARLYAQGMTGTQIAEALGISQSYTYQLLHDPDGSKNRARKRKYDLVCVECGGRVAGGQSTQGRRRDDPVCAECAPKHYAMWTREAIICAVQEWADEHGGVPPTAPSWAPPQDLRGPYPALNTVQKVFGSWNAAIRAAGFEPHSRGPLGGYETLTPEQREECARRYAAGESSTVIAHSLGCTPSQVTKWARRTGVPIRPSMTGKRAA